MPPRPSEAGPSGAEHEKRNKEFRASAKPKPGTFLLLFDVLGGLLLSLCLLLCSCGSGTEELRLIDIPLTQEAYAFGVDPAQPELLEQVNTFIRNAVEDGTLDRICENYFGSGTPQTVESARRDASRSQLVVATNAMFAPFEYTRGDRIIAWSVFGYAFVYNIVLCFFFCAR